MSTNSGPDAHNDHPVTYLQAAPMPASEALIWYQLLERRDRLSKTSACAHPQGGRRRGGVVSEPLTVREFLELLSLGEHLARHFRDSFWVHQAVQVGATWPGIAAARAETSLQARQNYVKWADEQRAIAEADPGMTTGMSKAEHVIARAAASMASCPYCDSRQVFWAGNAATSESWRCGACHRDFITGDQA
jgi:uncharacterized Zn-finger protein